MAFGTPLDNLDKGRVRSWRTASRIELMMWFYAFVHMTWEAINLLETVKGSKSPIYGTHYSPDSILATTADIKSL